MPKYIFTIRGGHKGNRAERAAELNDDAAALTYASELARELVQSDERPDYLIERVQGQHAFNDHRAPAVEAKINHTLEVCPLNGIQAGDKQIQVNSRHSELPGQPGPERGFAHGIHLINGDEERETVWRQCSLNTIKQFN